jgi:hypothetical protein
MADDSLEGLEGVARDASTIINVLHSFEREGFTGQFAARADGVVECLTCKESSPASASDARALRRLEGASDPDDMLAVAALVCPRCGARGTLLLNYGPLAPAEDADVLRALQQPPPPSPRATETEESERGAPSQPP